MHAINAQMRAFRLEIIYEYIATNSNIIPSQLTIEQGHT
jgi:hypothetical protein